MRKSLEGINKLKIWVGIIISFVESFSYFILPLVVSIYLNDSSNLNMINTFVIIFIAFIFIRTAIRVYMRRYLEFYLVKVSYIISNNIMKKLFKSDIKTLQLKGSGYVNSVIKRYNKSLDGLIENIFYNIPDGTVAIGIFIYATTSKSLILGIVAFTTIAISTIVYLYLQNKQEVHMDKFNMDDSEYQKHYVDYILNIRTVKLLNIYGYIKKILDNKVDKAVNSSKKKHVIEALKEALANIITFIPVMVGIIYAVDQFVSGRAGIGLIVFFVMSQGDLRYAIRCIGQIAKAFSEYKVARSNLNECILDINDKDTVRDFKKLEIRELKFKYESSEFEIDIKKFSVNKNDKVAVIGKSGQGKTTLLNILSKSIKTDCISINGDLKDIDIEYGYVTQEAEMFNTSIKENLCLDKDISDEYIIELLESVMLKHWYDNLKEGLNTEIGEKGLKLSTGQKQRLNLLRAILQDKEVYILDEPTSNLDEHTEEKVVEAINKYLGNKTLIIVTHRKKVLDLCNKIYEFNNHVLSKLK